MSHKKVLAAQQGELDCLCGMYGIINAMNYLHDGRIKKKAFLRNLVACYKKKWDVYDLLTYGMDEPEMDYVLIEMIMCGKYGKRYPVKISKPFSGQKRLRTAIMINEMREFMNQPEYDFQRVILFSTQDHWTVIRKIDSTHFHFFDSTGGNKSPINAYSLVRDKKEFYLPPDAIYFFERVI